MLTAIRKVGTAHDGQALWLCKCDCGNTHIARGHTLRRGETKSCGCKRNELLGRSRRKHGMTNTRIYSIWAGMKNRCFNPLEPAFKNYGNRGITVCDDWKNSFEVFCEWAMENGYSDNLSIDRIDNNGNYCPENCRWVTPEKQANNRRSNHYIEFNGETHTIQEWSRITGIRHGTIERRINKIGCSIEDALTRQPHRGKPFSKQC